MRFTSKLPMKIPMKIKLIQCSIAVLLLSSCMKENDGPEIIVEPPWPIEVKVDSIMSGTLYNLTVGDHAEEVYKGLQGLTDSKGKIEYLSITGLFNTKVEDLKDRIPLYNALRFDQKPSSPLSAYINFKGDKIESIYYRDGNRTSKWPNDAADALQVGDPVSSVYDKLVKLEKNTKYARMFEYIGMHEKNMNKSFDSFQNKSKLWQFSIIQDDKNFIRINLEFKDAKLVKIRSRHERYL